MHQACVGGACCGNCIQVLGKCLALKSKAAVVSCPFSKCTHVTAHVQMAEVQHESSSEGPARGASTEDSAMKKPYGLARRSQESQASQETPRVEVVDPPLPEGAPSNPSLEDPKTPDRPITSSGAKI